ncbi:MAG: amidohydrolase family protein [Planctomycetes bacterium]|nr:amidohydrolase family protein [Planctomycetota bacterium]
MAQVIGTATSNRTRSTSFTYRNPSLRPARRRRLHAAPPQSRRRYAEKAIGPERCKTSYAFRSLLDAGAPRRLRQRLARRLARPLPRRPRAVTGLSLDNKLFVPEQNITVEEALTCYTRNAARAAGDQDSLGMIRAGYLADFVILADDPFTIDPKNLGEFRGDTYVAGKLVASTSTNPPASVKHASAYPPSAEPDRTSHACHCCNRSSPARSSKQKMGGMGNRSRGLDLHCKSDHRESVEHRAQE